jgi:hypothetical protein
LMKRIIFTRSKKKWRKSLKGRFKKINPESSGTVEADKKRSGHTDQTSCLLQRIISF